MKSKNQGSLEYLLLIGGAVIVAAIVISLIISASQEAAKNVKDNLPVSASDEIKILKTQDLKDFLHLAVGNSLIRDDGISSKNYPEFWAVSEQRVAANMVMRGIAENEETVVERGWKGIEFGFSKQEPDGNFYYNPKLDDLGITEEDKLEDASFFLEAAGHSIALLQNSGFKNDYAEKIQLLEPKIELSLDWLEANKEALKLKAANAPNRLVFDALAFSLNGRKAVGEEFIQEALSKQHSQGYFIEHGGFDSSYNAVSILKLELYQLYFPSSQIENAIKESMAWEKTRILPSGEVNVEGNTRTGSCQEQVLGECKQVDYPSVALSFHYYAKMFNDPESLEFAEKITDYAVNNLR